MVKSGAEVGAGAPTGPQAAGRNWRDLRLRLLSAALLAPLGLACIRIGGWLFALLVMLGLAGAGLEWAGLLRHPPRSVRAAVLLAWPSVACLAALVPPGRWLDAVLMLAAPVLLGPAVAIGTVTIGLAGLSLLWLRDGVGTGWDSVLFVVLVVWSSDSFAYLAGRALGGPRLAPRISPGKTWSGSLGGLLGAMLVGAVLALLLPVPPAWRHGTALLPVAGRGLGAALLLGLASQAGDLAESAFKRRSGVKDSGRLIPGHGGLLDRFDGLLAAAPVAALLSLAAPQGAGFWYAFDLPHASGQSARGPHTSGPSARGIS